MTPKMQQTGLESVFLCQNHRTNIVLSTISPKIKLKKCIGQGHGLIIHINNLRTKTMTLYTKTTFVSALKTGVATGVAICLLGTTAMAATLKEAVSTALQENPEIQVSVKEKMADVSRIREARAGFFPTLDFEGDVGYQYTENTVTRASNDGRDDEELTRNSATLSLRQMIFDGLQTFNDVDQALATSEASSYAVVAQAEQVGLDAIQAYLEVMRRSRIVQLSRANVNIHKKYMNMVQERAETGVGSRADVSQASARLGFAESTLLDTLNNLRDSVSSYERIVGESPYKLMRPTMPVEALPVSLEAAVDMAQANHPIVMSAEKRVTAAHFQAQSTKSSFLPRFDIEIDGTRADDIEGIEGRDENLTALLVMRYNLYNGGGDTARQRTAIFERSRQQSVLDQAKRVVAEEAKFSWHDMVTTRNQVDTLERVLASNIEVRDSYLEQFELGQRSLLDLLDSENELFLARNDLVNSRYESLFNSYRVLASVGKLLPSVEVPIPEHYAEIAMR